MDILSLEMSKPREEHLIQVGCRLPVSVNAKLEKAAERERRSKASYIRILIEDALKGDQANRKEAGA